VLAEIDVASVHSARAKIPNLKNARSFVLDEVARKFGSKSVLPARLMEPGAGPG